jgi:serine/threonine-protein kinase
MVISTTPGPGAKVERGSTIEAALSQGPERYPMPVVVGLTRAAAEGAIEKAKLSVGKVVDGFSEKGCGRHGPPRLRVHLARA